MANRINCLYLMAFLLLTVPGKVWGQKPPTDLFSAMKPDVTVVVQKHSLGADLVEVTYLASNFPVEAAQRQIDALGKYLNVAPRGVAAKRVMLGSVDSGSVLRCNFAVDGLINATSGELNLEPIIRSFAGVPEPHTIHGLMLTFIGVSASPQAIQHYFAPDDSLAIEGRADDDRFGIEYRVWLGTQNPMNLHVATSEQDTPKVQAKIPKKSNDWVAWTILLIASIAAGALVYSLTLSRRTTKVSRGRQ